MLKTGKESLNEVFLFALSIFYIHNGESEQLLSTILKILVQSCSTRHRKLKQ